MFLVVRYFKQSISLWSDVEFYHYQFFIHYHFLKGEYVHISKQRVVGEIILFCMEMWTFPFLNKS